MVRDTATSLQIYNVVHVYNILNPEGLKIAELVQKLRVFCRIMSGHKFLADQPTVRWCTPALKEGTQWPKQLQIFVFVLGNPLVLAR